MRMYRYEVEVVDGCGNTTSFDFYLVLYDINPPLIRDLPPDHSAYTYSLSNSLGQVVKRGRISRGEDITLDKVPAGIYVLRINEDHVTVRTEKIVLSQE